MAQRPLDSCRVPASKEVGESTKFLCLLNRDRPTAKRLNSVTASACRAHELVWNSLVAEVLTDSTIQAAIWNLHSLS
jgi:hypothetical protein